MHEDEGSSAGGDVVVEQGLFRVVASSASDGIVVIDPASTILFANESTARMFGYDREELIGVSLTRLMPEYLRHVHEAALERYLQTGEKHVHWGGVELPGLHREGHEIPVEVSFGETVEDGRRLFTGIIRDVSERNRARQRWEALFDIATTFAGDDSLEVATVKIIKTICKCLDWEVGVFWQPDESGVLRGTLAWHQPHADAAAFLEATKAQPLQFGEGVPGRVAASREPAWVSDVELDDNFPRIAAARDLGLHSAFAFPVVSGERLIGVMEFYSPHIREPDFTLLNLINTTSIQFGQFVQRRGAEEALVRLNSELEQRVAERTSELNASNEELESFVNSVSHDLRSPLRGVAGFSQVLLEDFGSELDDTATRYVERIRDAAGRMGELIDDLLNLARISRSRLQKQQVDLSEIAEDIIRELRQQRPHPGMEARVASGLVAEGDRGLLRIVLENLIENSWKFTAKSPEPFLEVGATESRGQRVFYIKDNGAGFDMAYADKLFKPFQRLHSNTEFEGTGIGLTTVERIIRRHGGSVWVESQQGQGTTFYFSL